ncbi:MAG: pseudouridine synthase [Clostridia bacterium]
MNILYEDNHLLVVEKPVNMPVQADMSGDADLLTALKQYLKEKYQKPGDVYLGLVHRLDRPVGGVMVFARTSKASARLSAQFSNHTAKKRYVAVVCGTPQPEASLTDWLVKDEQTFSSSVVPASTEGSKEARMRYTCLGRTECCALLDIELYTGRPHQIRVQLAHAGLPLWGDQRYHPSAQAGAQIALWAYALTLNHPTLGEAMTFFCAPRGAAFVPFSAQTALLPAFRSCRGVFVDDELIVVDKNAGVETEGELLAELKSIFDPVYAVHRLDANTEGLICFARTLKMQNQLTMRFREHDLQKIYHCIVRGTPASTGRLIDWLLKDADEATVRVCSERISGALRCELTYRVLKTDGVKSLLEVTLITGRTHQIRVQLASAGYPLLGDDKYGDRDFNKANRCKKQALLCKRLSINEHVFISERELSLSCTPCERQSSGG